MIQWTVATSGHGARRARAGRFSVQPTTALLGRDASHLAREFHLNKSITG